LCVAFALAATGAPAQQTVYKWVDKDGKIHFSDTPPADRDAQEKRVGGGGPSEEQMPYATQMAMKSHPVTVYTSNDCGDLCERGRELLNKRGVPFTERNAEKSPEDAAKLKQLAGGFQVPVMTVGEKTVKGFSETAWTSALDDAGYAKGRLPGQTGPKTQ
jgi:glutaredoxin